MSENNRLLLAIIIRSTRQGRFAPTVANWFAGQAGRRDDMTVDVIDLAEARLPDVLADKPGPEVTAITPGKLNIVSHCSHTSIRIMKGCASIIRLRRSRILHGVAFVRERRRMVA